MNFLFFEIQYMCVCNVLYMSATAVAETLEESLMDFKISFQYVEKKISFQVLKHYSIAVRQCRLFHFRHFCRDSLSFKNLFRNLLLSLSVS